MNILFPRLSSVEATRCMTDFLGRSLVDVADSADRRLESLPVTYAETGGSRVEHSELLRLRSEVREIARAAGYPGPINLAGQQKFDREASVLLRRFLGAETGEALRAEMWQFMAAGLLPDIVYWRFEPATEGEGVTPARYLGGNRNCLGRLWQRAAVFHDESLDDPEVLVRELKEDNFVAILERSAFAAHPEQCREVARAFLLRRRLVTGGKAGNREADLLRDAMRRFTRATGHRALWALDQAMLEATVADFLDTSLSAMGIEPAAESELLTGSPSFVRKYGGPSGLKRVTTSVSVASADVIADAPEIPAPVSDPTTQALELAASLGVEVVDKSENGGNLWFVAARTNHRLEQGLEKLGLSPRFASRGSRATGGKPAWWVIPPAG